MRAEGVGREGEDAEGVRDGAVQGHGHGLAQRNAPHAEDLGPFGPLLSGHEVLGQKPHRVLVGDRVGEESLPEPTPASGFQSGLLPELAPGSLQRLLVLRAAALRYLPGVTFQSITVLADEVDVVVFHRQDADGRVLVVDYAVDSGLAVGLDHAVFADRDPGVLVDAPRTERAPRVLLPPDVHPGPTSSKIWAKRASSRWRRSSGGVTSRRSAKDGIISLPHSQAERYALRSSFLSRRAVQAA